MRKCQELEKKLVGLEGKSTIRKETKKQKKQNGKQTKKNERKNEMWVGSSTASLFLPFCLFSGPLLGCNAQSSLHSGNRREKGEAHSHRAI